MRGCNPVDIVGLTLALVDRELMKSVKWCVEPLAYRPVAPYNIHSHSEFLRAFSVFDPV